MIRKLMLIVAAIGALALPAVAADSAEGAVNELIDAVEAGEFEAIEFVQKPPDLSIHIAHTGVIAVN